MRKFISKAVLFAAIGLCAASCKSTYYQVYNVQTDGLKQQENSLVYENDDCKVLYNFWSEDGELRFIFLNKTDKDIFVNMGQSFYVVNGNAVDYYQERTFTYQDFYQSAYTSTYASANANGSGFWGDGIYQERGSVFAKSGTVNQMKATSKSVTTKEKEVVCIPAKCFKVFSYYKVAPARVRTCENAKDYPSKSCVVGTYTRETTPVVFKNRIAYGFSKSDIADKHIDNDFYITAITNYSQKSATEKVTVKNGCDDWNTYKTREFKIGGPDKFYKTIER